MVLACGLRRQRGQLLFARRQKYALLMDTTALAIIPSATRHLI